MSPTRRSANDRPDDSKAGKWVRRRQFLAFGTATGATLFAGCSAGSVPGESDDAATSTVSPAEGERDENAGTFRLLISDRPADVSDFDSLDVSFDRARIFGGRGVESEEGTEPSTASPSGTVTATGPTSSAETASPTESSPPTDTPPETSSPEGGEDGERGGDGGRGFHVLDLGGATVDLTEVVGERAIGIGEEDVPEGTYTKIELHAAGVEGIVDGEPVDVKIPSGKLQITKPFVVEAGETVSFVFDINVVRKGRSDAYNLLPVISESGVAGEDVEVDEVGDEGADRADETEETDGASSETGGDAGKGDDASEGTGDGPPDDGAGGSKG